MNALELRVGKIEGLMGKLAQGQMNTMEVLQELAGAVHSDLKTAVASEMILQKEMLKSEVKQDVVEVKQDVVEVKSELDKVNEKLQYRAIDRHQIAKIDTTRKARVFQLLGGKNSDEYILLSSQYMASMTSDLKKVFNVSSYKDISQDEYPEAMNFVREWTMDRSRKQYFIKILKQKLIDDELNKKQASALKRLCGIVDCDE